MRKRKKEHLEEFEKYENIEVVETKEKREECEREETYNKIMDCFQSTFPSEHKTNIRVEDVGFASESEPLMTCLVQHLTSTHVEQREKTMSQLCNRLNAIVNCNPPPSPGSIACAKHVEEEVLMALEQVEASQYFQEVTDIASLKKAAKAVELITGYNVITGKSTPMISLTIQSRQLKNKNIVSTEYKVIESAIRKDLAKFYHVHGEDITIRHILHGSIQVLFSLPSHASNANTNLRSCDFGCFKKIAYDLGITDAMNAVSQNIMPDKMRAVKLMKQYVRPVVIKTKDPYNKSELMTKFGKYLPVLASLSTHVRNVFNETTNELEIHGPLEARADIIAYFEAISDALQSIQVKNITIVTDPMTASSPSSSATKLWQFLYQKAEEFVMQTYTGSNRLHTLCINTELEKGCPVGEKFLNALKKLRLSPENPQKVFDSGVPFGWHGTRNALAVSGIAHENLDPGRRSGQLFGPGEYCADDASYSQDGGYWGTTNTLFVFFIIRHCPYYKFSTHHVVNNPSASEMYMVPILVATFNDQVPLPIDCPSKSQKPSSIKWEWENDDGWTYYGKGQPVGNNALFAIEDSYQRFKAGTGASSLSLSFVRLNDNITANYIIDFIQKKQMNSATKYNRKIRRLVDDKECY